MKIERIELYHISQKLVAPFVTSFGPQQQRDCLIVTIHSAGLAGWGECVATNTPGYSYETVGTAWHVLSDFLIPAILGNEINEPEDLGRMLHFVRGHPLAKASLEQAIWDLTAQRDFLSFAAKLALPYTEGPKERVKVGVSIGIQPSIADTLAVIAHHLEQGYQRIKLKIKPGHDVEVARQARAAFPNTAIMLDANSAYRLTDAPLLARLDDLNLLMLEQPLGYEDIYDHSLLHPQIATPLCLDESIHSVDHARYALALDACDIINIKPARVTGWVEARRIHDLCRENGIPVWCGGMLETGVGRAAQLALASLPGFTLPGDISATERYYVPDITAPFTLNREDSTISVPQGPGLGVEVDRQQLQAVTLRYGIFPET
jgi:O-succinylbenzoate synthase